MTRIISAVLGGSGLRETIFEYGSDWFSKRKAEQWSREPDEVVIGHRVSPACYIADAFPASLYLAWKYADDFEAGVITNANLGGDNCHRGAVLGAMLGAAAGTDRMPSRFFNGLYAATALRQLVDELLADRQNQPRIGGNLMNPTYYLLFAFSLTVLPAVHAEKIDNRNFAIDTCYPTPNEIRLAEERARNYWTKNAARYGSNPVYLAVETSKIFPGEVQDLSPKLTNSETTGSFSSRGIVADAYSDLQLLGVMIFDTRTGRFVSNQGYISVDTPQRGSVARFGPYVARFIGWG